MPRRALLFDFGGTLDSDGVHWSTQYAHAFAAAGIRVDRERLDQAFLRSERAFDARDDLAGHTLAMQIHDQILAMVRDLNIDSAGVVPSSQGVEKSTPAGYSTSHPEMSEEEAEALAAALTALALAPMERALAAARAHLAALRPPLCTALVSNFTENLPVILDQYGLTPHFDALLCSTLEGVKKPDHTIFHRALERLGCAPGEAVMVGDSLPADIMPAKELGLTTVWIRGDQVFGRGDEGAADHQVQTLAQAIAVVRELAGLPPEE